MVHNFQFANVLTRNYGREIRKTIIGLPYFIIFYNDAYYNRIIHFYTNNYTTFTLESNNGSSFFIIVKSMGNNGIDDYTPGLYFVESTYTGEIKTKLTNITSCNIIKSVTLSGSVFTFIFCTSYIAGVIVRL